MIVGLRNLSENQQTRSRITLESQMNGGEMIRPDWYPGPPLKTEN
jgi:hypothetical protein